MNCKSALLLLAYCLPLTVAKAQELSVDDGSRSLQRQLYTNAQAALANGNRADYQRLVEQLSDYPLLSYLEHAELSRALSTLPATRVDAFLERQAGTVLAARLERQWLAELVTANRPADLIRYYNPANTTTELTCRVLMARLDSGDSRALDEVALLWNVAVSQHNACDPVFSVWLAAGRLSPEIGWQRFNRTLRAGQLNLARYISRLLPAREEILAQTYLEIHQYPNRLSQLDIFSVNDPLIEELILYGLQRLSLSNGMQALALLNSYAARHNFVDAERHATERFIAQRLLFQGQIAEAEALLLNNPPLRSETVVEWLLRDALSQQDWSRLDSWLLLLPESAQESERWRYWKARSLLQRETPEAVDDALTIFKSLADLRSFYGFLSADILGQPYAFVDRPVPVSEADLVQLGQLPALDRAHELYLLGDETNALREWEHTLASLNEAQIMTAGKLASSWGWHRNGIQAMIRVSYWDDLQLRFPFVYQEQVADAVNTHPLLNTFFVYAIARQESAFITDAVSSAGAMGLMQLMPATARETAREAGMRISNRDLLQPEINIALGSRYLARQLQDFGGNRILAAAAYNAGPNRVRQWRPQSSNLPIDIWIETIPFGETRDYVQNVLAYAVIYAHRNGERVPLITDFEASWGLGP